MVFGVVLNDRVCRCLSDFGLFMFYRLLVD